MLSSFTTTPRSLQSIHLLPHALEPGPVARFLRFCPGLGKASIGEVLGERDAFYENVRQAFIDTFQFTGAAPESACACNVGECCVGEGWGAGARPYAPGRQ